MRRLSAVFVKELIQLRRDRLTFATMIMIPVMQLILFGFAINSDPKHLPTAVLDNDHSALFAAVHHSLQATDYFDIRYTLSGPEQIDPLILSGAVNFAVEIPQDFARKSGARRKPGHSRHRRRRRPDRRQWRPDGLERHGGAGFYPRIARPAAKPVRRNPRPTRYGCRSATIPPARRGSTSCRDSSAPS